MNARRWIAVVIVLLLVTGAITLVALPGIVRRVAEAQVRTLTGRPTVIERVELAVFRGRATVHSVRLMERDGTTPFAEFPRLDLRVSLPSLLVGHVWIRELSLTDSIVRLVRLPNAELNVSDLLGKSESTEKRHDITVDHFRIVGGTVTLQDLAVPGAPVWRSEQMAIDARNVSTRRDDGTAVATSVTAGAPVRITVSKLRLHPIHMEAAATIEGLDLTPAQVYFPPSAQFRIERGRLSTTATIVVDAADGIRADATGRMDDVVLADTKRGDVVARMPALTAQVAGFALRDDGLAMRQFAANGTVSVRDPTVKGGGFKPSTVRVNVSDLTWPATTPGVVDVQASIPGGGTLAVAGTVRPPPAATQLALRVAGMSLAPWAQFFPVNAAIAGVASVDLRIDEPLAAGVPAHVLGTAAVDRLSVSDAGREVLGSRRVEAGGLEVHWPERLAVQRVVVTGPRAVIERDAAGKFALTTLAAAGDAAPRSSASPSAPPLRVTVGEVVVRGGAVLWRDATVKPAARLDIADLEATITGGGWPLSGPLGVRLGLRPPGGGRVNVTGRLGIDPVSADVRVTTRNAELAPYRPYLPTTAGVSGAADLDLAIVVPTVAEPRATARGSAALARVDVRDGQRTIARAERAMATGVDVAWPERIVVQRLALARPWILLERDDKGALPLRALFPAGGGSASATPGPDVTISHVTVEDGGLRVVDRAISPAFAVDVAAGRLRADGLSTGTTAPAKLDLTARVGGTAELALRGTLGALGGPLKLDLDGELREFAVPRANSYLVDQVGWKSREGRVSAKVRARIDGDALNAKTDIRVSRLQLVRATDKDEAQNRIGLPLGTLTSLMKDRRGDIRISLPVGGRLNDPRFDLRDTIWSAVRTVALNAITLPVSWIGRVQVSADSKIQKIHVDPLPFEPGTAELTPDGRVRLTRLTAFLEQLPDVRLALTPVVSAGDIAEIQRRTTTVTREARPSAEGAALPRVAVADPPPLPASVAPDLAKRRLEAVRDAFKQAGVERDRFVETAVAERNTAEAQIELEVLEPEGERPSKMRQLMRKLGVTRGDDD
jgi:hypothetical protein